jgi:hypothetical protein
MCLFRADSRPNRGWECTRRSRRVRRRPPPVAAAARATNSQCSPSSLARSNPHRRTHVSVRAAKELHFNKNMEALKKMQAGADKLATVVGVTLGPKVCARVSLRLSRFGQQRVKTQ